MSLWSFSPLFIITKSPTHPLETLTVPRLENENMTVKAVSKKLLSKYVWMK